MNQNARNTELKRKSNFKLMPYRTLPCSVTLRGLVVRDHRRTPLGLKGQLIQWDRITIPDYYARVKTNESGDSFVLASGHRLRLKFANNRAVRVALRAKHRYLNRAWHNGEVSVDREFSISKQMRKHLLIKLSALTIVWLILNMIFFVPLVQSILSLTGQYRMLMLLLIGILFLCSLTILGIVLFMGLAVSKFNVTNIKLNTEGLEVALLDGRKLSKNWHEVSSFRKCGLRYEITCTDGDKVIMPACRPIIPNIELIQQDFFPACVEKESQATRRFIIRSCVLLVGGFMITAVLLSYLQGIEPVDKNELGIVAILLLIGLAAPASMIFIMWLATTFDPHISERIRRNKRLSIQL